MIKLTAENDRQHATWYFRTNDEVAAFIYEFTGRGCSINWKKEEKDKFEGLTDYQKRDMDRSPKERAKANLCWAFNSYLPDNPGSDISGAMAASIMRNLGV